MFLIGGARKGRKGISGKEGRTQGGSDFGLREPPGGPRSGGEAMSEAKPVRWRPCEAGARPNYYEFSHTLPR